MLSVRLGEKTFVCDCVTKRSLNFWNNLPTNPFTKTYETCILYDSQTALPFITH